MSSSYKTKRVRLSALAAKTQRMFFVFSSFCIVALGMAYLFATNYAAIRGYALTKETRQELTLRDEIESLEAQIAQKSASNYIFDASYLKEMIVQEQINYFVLEPQAYTAQLSSQKKAQ